MMWRLEVRPMAKKTWGAFQFGIWILIFSERSFTGIIFTSCLITSSSIWVNYNDLTTTSLESFFFFKGRHPQMALIQVNVKYYNLPRLDNYGIMG